MRRAEGLELPAFFNYYDTPVKVVGTPDGGMLAWKLVRETGGWQSADRLIDKILLVGGDGVEALSRSEFIELTEYERGRYLRGSGPVFALYETVSAITDALARERRYPTPEETALIRGIHQKTFVMFEEELQRAGEEGADPLLTDS
ncbi:hypothetical protein GA0074696_5660 [Micromonospora purpureochromogenes]|uniref:Uncharacterized protein n=1 Tax=Micromonospora purpureochromogenes TaxID=47872 RepID=A0A1C5AAV6_9ACTN|nr:hypothetical protein [Micromonospora purpureochromogenes]SCF42347.1 hypothetical protein GA0074696_5660 [Micromonospora purpureochromogenes]